ncbi:hypothetical protein A9Q83_11450 [Alphaproteobacteria bacterium 46_93_T64]|nr:hypothetical protein A9Q83_11450 [Alphaproteobacteria bacterium 46_93_T64]
MHRLDWSVDQDGYKIIELEGERGLYSGSEPYDGMVRYIVQKGGPKKEYSPMLQNAAIHRELAMLDQSKSGDEEVLSFCGKYGLLEHEMKYGPYTGSGFNYGFRVHPQLGPMPINHIMSIEYFWHLQEQVQSVVAHLDRNDKRAAVHSFNTQWIQSIMQLEHNPRSGKYSYINAPINLNAAIWLLIEQEISGERSWLRCQNCQTWFIPKTKRAVYCRQACKVAWHRKLKQAQNT